MVDQETMNIIRQLLDERDEMLREHINKLHTSFIALETIAGFTLSKLDSKIVGNPTAEDEMTEVFMNSSMPSHASAEMLENAGITSAEGPSELLRRVARDMLSAAQAVHEIAARLRQESTSSQPPAENQG